MRGLKRRGDGEASHKPFVMVQEGVGVPELGRARALAVAAKVGAVARGDHLSLSLSPMLFLWLVSPAFLPCPQNSAQLQGIVGLLKAPVPASCHPAVFKLIQECLNHHERQPCDPSYMQASLC